MERANQFQDRYCDICDRKTLWYGTHCTQHSAWKPGVTHPVAVLRSSLGMSKELPIPPTERELRQMNRIQRKLLSISDHRQDHVEVDYSWAYAAVGIDPEDAATARTNELRDPNKTYCTFCGAEVDYINVLSERGKPRIRFSDEIVMDADTREVHSYRKVQVFSEKLNACPKCVLNIRKPITVQRV